MIKDIINANEKVTLNGKEMSVLRENFPACFRADGSFDITRFSEFLKDKIDISHEGYELKFLGKNYAKMLASLDTETVIVPDEAHNSLPENINSENVYISGDNLDGLKHLLKSYAGQVKCIYIDPPYNTGSDGFVYNDKFNFTVDDLVEKLSIDEEQAQRILDLTNRGSASHSAWLMFMYSRLQLARDPHQESMEDYVVQHITVENFKHQSSAAVYNILKELVIKKDIATGKITLVDWSQYGYKADWLFGVVVDGTYYFMTIHPDGSFKIEALKRNFFTMTEYDKYMDYFGLNEENKNDYRGVIGLVKDAEGNINLIKDTNMYSMPDYTAMGDVLKNVASEGRFPGKDVVTWLRLVMDTTDKIKVLAELDIVIPHIDVNAEYTKANVMGLFKGITTKKEVVRYVFENTGIMLYAYLRGEEERREYLSGNIDINYFDYDDTHAKYSVGEIGNGMKYTIERASVVREIQAVEGSKLIFKKVLPLMGVEFVRYGMLTVVPFPFKYLRE